MTARDHRAGGKRDGAGNGYRRGDDPALGRRENNHRNNNTTKSNLKGTKNLRRDNSIEEDNLRRGKAKNNKEPPPHARTR